MKRRLYVLPVAIGVGALGWWLLSRPASPESVGDDVFKSVCREDWAGVYRAAVDPDQAQLTQAQFEKLMTVLAAHAKIDNQSLKIRRLQAMETSPGDHAYVVSGRVEGREAQDLFSLMLQYDGSSWRLVASGLLFAFAKVGAKPDGKLDLALAAHRLYSAMQEVDVKGYTDFRTNQWITQDGLLALSQGTKPSHEALPRR